MIVYQFIIYIGCKYKKQSRSNFLSRSEVAHPFKAPLLRSKLNGFIHIICKIVRHVVCSAAEAEIAADFLTAQSVVPMRITLEALGYTQNATAIVVDNSMCHGLLITQLKKNLKQ